MDCALCGAEMEKAIYLALPGRLCTNAGCYFLDGLAGFVISILPIASEEGFVVMTYTGSYPAALWHWLKGIHNEN